MHLGISDHYVGSVASDDACQLAQEITKESDKEMVFAIIGTIILVIATAIGNVIMRNWLYFVYSLLICVLSCWALFLER